MQDKVLRLDPRDTVIIALTDLKQGESVSVDGQTYDLATDVAAKHKFSTKAFSPGDPIFMYGVMVGRASAPIRAGEAITTLNIRHDAAAFHEESESFHWHAPDVSKWKSRTFAGYLRADGQVGTRNYWLVVPLVFCENRNLLVLKQAFEEELGCAADLPSVRGRFGWSLSRGQNERGSRFPVLEKHRAHGAAADF
jgi:altronate hydrolase